MYLIRFILTLFVFIFARTKDKAQAQQTRYYGNLTAENFTAGNGTFAVGNSTAKSNSTCQRCEQYKYNHCTKVLQHYNTTISIDCDKEQIDLETELLLLSSSLEAKFGSKDDCLAGLRWTLCLTTLRPGCQHISPSQGLLCEDACMLIKHDICQVEWKEAMHNKNNLPNCTDLPSQNSTLQNGQCIFPQLFKDMINARTRKKEKIKDSKSIIAAASGGGFGLVIILIVILLICRRHKQRKKPQKGTVSLKEIPQSEFFDGLSTFGTQGNDGYDEDNPLYNKVATLNELNVKKLPRDCLRYIEPLAEGAFGKVVKCELFLPSSATGPRLTAVKYLKDDASEQIKLSFSKEAQIVGSFDHPNIVSLLGICVDDKGPPCMILEFMEGGDLTKHIRDKSGSYHASFGRNGILPEEVEFKPPEVSFKELVDIARQISAGMAYLAERRFVHRDLATRNCLLDKGSRIKIADFGLAHDISSTENDYYRIDGQRLLPIRWLPPEALTVGKFTIESDIWAYGVVLWELFTYGIQPFYGQSNEEVCDRIRCMKLLSRPDGCPQRVYQLMKSCWKYDPMKRPPFGRLHETLTMWGLTGKGQFLDDAWGQMLKPVSILRAPTLPVKRRAEKRT